MTDSKTENDKLKDEVKNLKAELNLAQKHRNKIEKVLKQASDSLVIALSVIIDFIFIKK